MAAALPPQPQKKLQPIPPPDQPWKHIGIDLVCDLQENTEWVQTSPCNNLLPIQIMCSTAIENKEK